jgi:DNA-binding transcriptional regulator GbsR (MarR family)
MRDLRAIQDDFIAQWGILGANWGISKTMAQIQALLIVSEEPLNTDQIMERLMISRGNAHGGLKELTNWGLVSKRHIKGERKEYFQTEKDPWKIFVIVARERRRREILPLLEILRQCEAETRDKTQADFNAFHARIKALMEFTSLGDSAMRRVAESEKNQISRWLLRLVRRKSK